MKSREEYVPAVIMVGIGAAFVWFAWGYGLFQSQHIGPGFLPALAGVLLAGFGAAIMLEVWRARRAPAAAAPAPGAQESPAELAALKDNEPRPKSGWSVFAILAIVCAAVIGTGYAGFLISFTLLTFAILFGVEREPLLRSLAISVGVGVLAWLVFVWFMGVQLPTGLLESFYSS